MMERAQKQADIARLRARIAQIERRPALAEANQARVTLAPNGLVIPAPGLLHEIFTDEHRNGAALLGFALAQARGFLSPVRPAVIYLQMPAEGQETGLPYGPGLAAFGFEPDAMTLVRPANVTELLWAAEEAIACRAVAAVLADLTGQPKTLDFTAARRLSMRAGMSGASMLLLRYGVWREASPAQLRWHIAPARSGRDRFDARAPGRTRWRVRIEKDAANRQDREWLVEWTKNGLQPANSINGGKNRVVHRPTLPGAYPAQLGHRLSQAT